MTLLGVAGALHGGGLQAPSLSASLKELKKKRKNSVGGSSALRFSPLGCFLFEGFHPKPFF